MTKAQQAAFRLLTTLPVRTHLRKERQRNGPVPIPGSVTPKVEERIRELAAQGKFRRDIERELRVGYFTVRRVLGPGKRPVFR